MPTGGRKSFLAAIEAKEPWTDYQIGWVSNTFAFRVLISYTSPLLPSMAYCATRPFIAVNTLFAGVTPCS